MQTALKLLYPPQCVSCGDFVESDFGLCGPCWGDTPFIGGLVCDLCGCPLPGEGDGDTVHCDDCMTAERPWSQGRAALIYENNARQLVLALKHGDRTDLAYPAAGWMARAVKRIVKEDTMLVPVPSHWSRLLQRRYNQAAELAKALSNRLAVDYAPDVLIRSRRTKTHDGLSFDDRVENMQGAICAHPKRGTQIAGRNVVLVDDVMTSGATFAAATHACLEAGASTVCVLSLARVVKGG